MSRKNLSSAIEQHKARVAANLATAKQQEIAASEAAERRFLASPEGQRFLERDALRKKAETERREAQARLDRLRQYHMDQRKQLQDIGLRIGTEVVALHDIHPVRHRHTDRNHYKIVMLPFEPNSEKLYRLKPRWVLIDDPKLMRKCNGMVAYCENPMKCGQRAKVVVQNEKSVQIRVQAKVEPDSLLSEMADEMLDAALAIMGAV